MTRTRRLAAVAAAATLAAATSACGTTDALVGLHPAPAESEASAPLDVDGATAIAARLLAQERAVAATEGKKGQRARAEVLTGDALRYADEVAANGEADDGDATLQKEGEPTVLAQSRGRDWPRAILATTLDEATSTQYLHVMVSGAPEEPFRTTASVPMFAGAQLPALGPDGSGAPFVDLDDDSGLAMSPAEAVEDYATALRRPAPKKAPADVSTDDPFATALMDSAKRQAKELGKLATLTQKHEADLGDGVAFRLADGGAVVFALMERTDTFTVGSKAKELVLPGVYAGLVGKKKVTDEFRLSSLEPVVLVVPAAGDTGAIGASDLLVSGKGS